MRLCLCSLSFSSLATGSILGKKKKQHNCKDPKLICCNKPNGTKTPLRTCGGMLLFVCVCTLHARMCAQSTHYATATMPAARLLHAKITISFHRLQAAASDALKHSCAGNLHSAWTSLSQTITALVNLDGWECSAWSYNSFPRWLSFWLCLCAGVNIHRFKHIW